MRAGAGYVTVAAPASLELAFAARLLEAMFAGLPEEDGALSPEALPSPRWRRSAAPTRSCSARASAARRARRSSRASWSQRIDVPLVIDADGLNALAGQLEDLRHRRWPTVLTPHAGELGRLLEVDSAEVERAPPATMPAPPPARAKAIVVLKGDDTLVAAPSGRVAVSPGRRAGARHGRHRRRARRASRARCSARASRPRTPPARRSTRTCARAGSRPRRTGPDGVIASDVIAALPAALAA